jgi:hypothetical protein
MYDSATEEIKDEKNQQPKQENFKLASVTELFTQDQCAKITFYGEDTPSEKEYSYLASYTPTIGDKVLLARVGESWVILGKVNYAEEPTALTAEQIVELINTTLVDGKYVKLTDNGTISNSSDNYNYLKNLEAAILRHTGSYLGFFNHTAVQQKSTTKLSVTSSTTAQDVGNKLNTLIEMLAGYGLISWIY